MPVTVARTPASVPYHRLRPWSVWIGAERVKAFSRKADALAWAELYRTQGPQVAFGVSH